MTPKQEEKAGAHKGYALEEALRRYFQQSGYYVRRGVELRIDGDQVTDIDLWLYGRTSSISRETAIVDCKNRKHSAVYERILWTSGLRQFLSATSAIVATREERSSARALVTKANVQLLDGKLVQHLLAAAEDVRHTSRSNEDFTATIRTDHSLSNSNDWLRRINYAVSLLPQSASFSAINLWLDESTWFAHQVIASSSASLSARRCCYLLLSLLAVGLDHKFAEITFLQDNQRYSTLADGLRFGDRGRQGVLNALEIARGMNEKFVPESASS